MKYYCPDSLDEYFKLSSKLADKDVVLLAGGTDLMPRFERGLTLPDHLIDLKHLSPLCMISVEDHQVKIGALTTVQDLHDHATIRDEFTALYQAAHEFAGAQIRHRGTIGGNICNASPAGDLLPCLYAFGATVNILGKNGQRSLPISEFILAPSQTDLAAGEILASINLPRNNMASKFIKVGLRQSMAISVVNIALVYSRLKISFTHLQMAVGATAPTVVMLDDFCDAYLVEPSKLSEHLYLIDEAISPIDDIRATANYRRTVLLNLIKDFLSI